MKFKPDALRDVRLTFRHKLVFKRRIPSEDPFIEIDKYEVVTEVMADERYIRSVERDSADSPNIIISKEFIIRYREDLDEDMIIEQHRLGKVSIYEIDGILPLTYENLYLKIPVREIKKGMN